MSADPFYMIPLFVSSGATTRITICLLVHPLLLEAGEALGRGIKGDATALKLRRGEINVEEAEESIVKASLPESIFKLLMAFYRRFMLLNMGNAQATMFAVVAASIEEAGALIPRPRLKAFN